MPREPRRAGPVRLGSALWRRIEDRAGGEGNRAGNGNMCQNHSEKTEWQMKSGTERERQEHERQGERLQCGGKENGQSLLA
jgi:hypothetical protein